MEVTVSVVVLRPAEEVFDALADVRNETAWNSHVTRAEMTSPEQFAGLKEFCETR